MMEKFYSPFLPPGTTQKDLDDLVHDGSDPAALCDAVIEAHSDRMIEAAFQIAVLNPRPEKV